jgi:hypothetical protein
MNGTFFKGVVLGAVVSAVTVVASAAIAGTGVGGVFNLGKTNAVNASTVLTGVATGTQLQVSNSSTHAGATAIGITVADGKPPLVVNSKTKVKNLNADQLDGLDSSELGQVRAISHTLPHSGFVTETIARSNVEIDYACRAATTFFQVKNAGPAAATIDWMYSDGGSASTVNTNGLPLGPGEPAGFIVNVDRLAGQFIFTDARNVVTINISALDNDEGCEFSGTAVVSTVG